jgi:hypothetical protein
MHLDRCHAGLAAIVALLLLGAGGLVGAESARADVCDSIPSIPMVPNPVKTGCKLNQKIIGGGPKLLTNPGGAAKDIITGPIHAAGQEVMRGVTGWVAKGAGWLIGQTGRLIGETTTPRITSRWFLRQYRSMGALAAVFALPLLLFSILQAVFKRDAGVVTRAAFVQLPLAFLLTAIAVTVVQLLLQLTDQMSAAVASSVGNDAKQFFSDTGKALGVITAGGTNPVPLFAVFLAGLVAAAGAFCVWLELLVRSAGVYVAVLFLPFTFVAMIWPATARWCRRLVEILFAIVFAKFVIVAIMALAAAGLGHSRGNQAFQGVLAGAALMLLAAFSPFVLLRLIPMAQSAAVGVGWRRGALGGAFAGPGVSPSMVMRRAMSSRSGGGESASPRAGSMMSSNGTGGGSAVAGGAGAAGAAAAGAAVAAVQAVGRSGAARTRGLGSYAEVGSPADAGSAGGRAGSPAAEPRATRQAVESQPRSKGDSPPEAPMPRPRDREGGVGGA